MLSRFFIVWGSEVSFVLKARKDRKIIGVVKGFLERLAFGVGVGY